MGKLNSDPAERRENASFSFKRTDPHSEGIEEQDKHISEDLHILSRKRICHSRIQVPFLQLSKEEVSGYP